MAKSGYALFVNGSDYELQSWRKALLYSESVHFRIPFANFERLSFVQRIG